MDTRAEIRDFLTSRRARLSPEQAGVPTYGGVRRVAGLRREEVAHLAGVSVDYYNRLERGRATGISPEVLASVACALQLDEVEHEHLRNLHHAARPSPLQAPRSRARHAVRPTVQKVLDALDLPAFVQNSRLEIVAANALGQALYADAEGDHRLELPFSMPSFVFLDPRSPAFYGDWSRVARNQVALLRTSAGRTPDDPELLALIGKLSTQSPHFRELWATHDVLKYRKGPKNYHHPVVGDIEFIGESFDLSEHEDLALLTYTYETNSPTEQAMTLLASWVGSAVLPSS
ncbi:putative DNA-binding protein [Corynebacterium xerosis]|uniref:helix-turn-helix transcriptional regulator n=1 Tax=Brachybacterium tyrofermentans TaxID=47848 RepID=UPI000A1B2F09|nr:putative DNA-binding protein [Corynebacterium xerosis]